MEEEWKQIWEFPAYSISTYGRIRNDDRHTFVKQSLTLQGAVKVGLMSDGTQYTRSVIRLVAETFIPQKNDKFNTPLHLDGDQQNNYIDNIVWRPRWFVWKYANQFRTMDKYKTYGSVVCRETGEVYASPVEAAISHGLLFFEIVQSAIEMTPVWPDWIRFHWAGEEEGWKK